MCEYSQADFRERLADTPEVRVRGKRLGVFAISTPCGEAGCASQITIHALMTVDDSDSPILASIRSALVAATHPFGISCGAGHLVGEDVFQRLGRSAIFAFVAPVEPA